MPRKALLLTLGLSVTLAGLAIRSRVSSASPAGQQASTAQPVEPIPTVIKTESNLVLVDVVATDKKGRYITDLEQKDFRVFEDDKEQVISTFSHESDVHPADAQRQHYIVLFFDDSAMDPSLQTLARKQALKFVETTASDNRQMAVMDFAGGLKIVQNFTADGQQLARAVASVYPSAPTFNDRMEVQTGRIATLGAPSLGRAQSDFGARSLLLSMRELAKSLQATPGRKTLIVFSAGFPLTPERESELTATVDALNKSNIAVYPVDIRGLVSPGAPVTFVPTSDLLTPSSPFAHLPGLLAALAYPLPDPQHGAGGGPGGGTGGGGGTPGGGGGAGGGTGGGAGGSGGAAGGSRGGGSSPGGGGGGSKGAPGGPGGGNRTNSPTGNLTGDYPRSGQILGWIPESVTTNQQVLYALAKGTGGFEIFNTNDFLIGLNKIAKEMNEYYDIGYTPSNQSHDGSFHRLKVKVERKGVLVRSRTGYYDTKSPDLLQGTPEGKTLEARINSPQAGEIPISVSTPYFYAEPGVARVSLAMSVPGSAINFAKRNGAFHSEVSVLGIAYTSGGSVAARFSDTVKLDFDEKKQVSEFAKNPFNYQNTFKIAPGSYTLKILLSSGEEKFAKYDVPFYVQPFDGSTISLAGPALGEKYIPISQLAAQMDEDLMEDRTPLVFQGMELVPSTTCHFAKGKMPAIYLEVYDPALKDKAKKDAPVVGVGFKIFDRKSEKQVYTSDTILLTDYVQPGNALVPLGFRLPVDNLQSGDYRIEIRGRDSVGNLASMRAADFTIQ